LPVPELLLPTPPAEELEEFHDASPLPFAAGSDGEVSPEGWGRKLERARTQGALALALVAHAALISGMVTRALPQ
jgi:hypothetical protein